MTRYTKNAHGHYLIHGHKYEMLEGSRAQVMHGTAYKTSGGLKKMDLLQNKNGRIVSKKKHATAKKEKRLVKAGYGTKKGHFGAVKLGSRKHRSKKMRGGYNSLGNLNPAPVDGNDTGVGVNTYNGYSQPSHMGGKRGKGKKGRRGGSNMMGSVKNMMGNGLDAMKAALPHSSM